MEVIERKEWTHVFDCKGCGSKLKADRSDVRYASYDEGSEYYVKCPVCGDTHKLEYNKIPSDIQTEAMHRKGN